MHNLYPAASAGPVRKLVRLGLAGAAFTALTAGVALAQQPAPAQKPPARTQRAPAKPPGQKPPQNGPAAQETPAAPQAQAPAAPGQPGQSAETPPLIYSPWTKVCGKEGQQQQPAGAKEVCFTIKEARLDTGQFVASAGLIELAGEPKKIMRVTLPLGLLLRNGTRMLIDGQQPMTGVYNFCLPNGCWADFEVADDFVGRLKKGQSLVLQAFNLNGQVASFNFPLADFAKSNEGPPTDPKALEEQQKKLQEELQKRAEEARRRLEQQQGQGQPQASTPPATPPTTR